MTPSDTKQAGAKPAGIVLAGGASTRFGSDKLAAKLDGRPVLAHAVGAVQTVASPVVLVLAPDAAVPAWVDADAGGLLVARDAERFGGPLVGMRAGLAALATHAPATSIVLVVAGDMPTLEPAVLELLAAALAGHPFAGASILEADPPDVFPLALRLEPAKAAVDTILSGGGKRSVRTLLDALRPAAVPEPVWRVLDPAATTLRDIDTPSDLG